MADHGKDHSKATKLSSIMLRTRMTKNFIQFLQVFRTVANFAKMEKNYRTFVKASHNFVKDYIKFW